MSEQRVEQEMQIGTYLAGVLNFKRDRLKPSDISVTREGGRTAIMLSDDAATFRNRMTLASAIANLTGHDYAQIPEETLMGVKFTVDVPAEMLAQCVDNVQQKAAKAH